MTRILHTADWHLGARLVECDRHEEHEAFLAWLIAQVSELKPDLLIVAGDVFDAANPPQEALNLYYQFLNDLTAARKCHVLILGGNHDSPGLLHAPRDLLRRLDVRVIASPQDNPTDHLWEFPDVVVCAVPYLRERDVRSAAAGQTPDQIAVAIRTGVIQTYRDVLALAQIRAKGRLVVATGHLTAAGGQGSPGERIIHIGSLGAVPLETFDGFAYTALGHLHRSQIVSGSEVVRYAGSPIPLSFAEVDGPKEVRLIDIRPEGVTQQGIAIPLFRPLLRVSIPANTLEGELRGLQAAEGQPVPWIELTVPDGRAHPDLDQRVRTAAANLRLRVLKVQVPLEAGAYGAFEEQGKSLNDFQPAEVFAARLRAEGIDLASPDGLALAASFAELLSGMTEDQEKK